MAISYNKLWKLLIDRKMKIKDLQKATINAEYSSAVSSATLAKMKKDENVNVEILARICTALDCKIGDIMDITSEDKN